MVAAAVMAVTLVLTVEGTYGAMVTTMVADMMVVAKSTEKTVTMITKNGGSGIGRNEEWRRRSGGVG